MSHIKKGEGNSLGDMLNPEVRNILEKLKRLGVLTYQMGIDTDKGTDIQWLQENLRYGRRFRIATYDFNKKRRSFRKEIY
jgi:hypothetical protein